MRFSLRSSLIAGVLTLTATALLALSGVGVVMMRSFLLDRVDEQLTGAAALVQQSAAALPTGLKDDQKLRSYISVTEFLIEVRKGDELLRLPSNTPLPRQPLMASGAARGLFDVTRGGDRYRAITTDLGGHATVLIALPLEPVGEAVFRLTTTALITTGAVLVILALLGRWLILRRLRPLDRIAEAATALADGDLGRRVPDVPDGRARRTEVGRLTVAVNGMLSRIQTALADRERSEGRMREFVADASHELRTPVTSIKGYLQLVRTGVVDLRERPDVLRRLEEEAGRIGVLVTDLLFLARLDAEPAPRRERVDLAGLVRDAVADARAVEPDRPITLDAPGPCVVEADAGALRQVLANLLGNVRTHTPAGTPARVTLDPAARRVTVADDGPGLTAEAAVHAFDRFWRGDSARSATGGAGLGLAIVAEAVRAHGGTVGIEPGPGFVLWFQLSPNSHPPRVEPAEAPGDMGSHTGTPSRGPSVATLLHRLGLAAYRRRVWVTAVWLVVLAATALGATTLSGETATALRIPGQESTTALDLIDQKFAGAGGAGAQVVLPRPAGAAELTRLSGELGSLPGVTAVAPPVIAPDRQAAYLTVTYAGRPSEITAEQRDALAAAASSAGAELTGDATVERVPSLGGPAEIAGVAIALLVLALTFGTLAVAGMNLLTAIIGVGIAALGLTTLTGFVDLQSTTPILAVMLGLAVGIDYALFIITRFRQELRDGRAGPDAIGIAVGTAGSAVVTAGVSVVIALAGLAVAGIPFLTEMGLAAAAAVVIAVLVAITLVPAALGFLGMRALPRRPRRERGFYRGWAGLVTGRPWALLLTGIVALAVVAAPVTAMRTSLNQPPAEGSTQARAAELLTTHFGPGVTGPLLVLVEGGDPAAVARQAQALPGVAAVTPPRAGADGSAALFTVVPASAPDSTQTEDLVHALRDLNIDGMYVSGQTAVSVDVSQTLSDALPIYLALVVGLALLLLVLVFRSLLVPAVGVLGFLLTIGAALGAATAVFQWGWLADLVNADATGPMMSLAPIIVIGILFGLAMDYQVFLVSRMHEAHAHGAPPVEAVRTGFRQAGPVVIAAATIMFAVFAGFVPEGDQTIKPIAFALAVGILVDAFVVRMVIMPAALTLFGRAAWWLPRRLSRLPTLDVEGAALNHHRPVPQPAEQPSPVA